MRLFIAIPLEEEIRRALAEIIFELKQKRGRVKWVTPKNIHLTLKFLGEVSPDLVAPIGEAITGVASHHDRFKTVIDRIGAFPNPRRPRVIWAGLTRGSDILQSMATEVDQAMAELGFDKEKRPFKSHLTLGRVKDDSGLNDLGEAVRDYRMSSLETPLSRVVLFKSTLTPAGPIYDRLVEAELPKS